MSGPIADMPQLPPLTPKRPQPERSFDHLVGDGQQCRGDCEAKRRRRLEVDDQLELGRLFDRQLAGIRALEDFVYVKCGSPKGPSIARTIRDQAARIWE